MGVQENTPFFYYIQSMKHKRDFISEIMIWIGFICIFAGVLFWPLWLLAIAIFLAAWLDKK